MKQVRSAECGMRSARHLWRALAIALVFVSVSVFVQAQRRERLIESWQPIHFDVKLVFNYSLTEISSATTEVTVLVRQNDVTMIDFDFGAMPVSAVKVNDEQARFAQHDEKLDVYLTQPAKEKQTLKISVTYSGKPKDGLILTKDKDGFPSAVGDNWADRVHHWIPCLDHPSAKATVRFTVTTSSNNVVVANGVSESTTNNPDTTKTHVWYERNNISPYNMVVVVGNFATEQLKQKSSVPISFYVPQSDRKFAAQGFSPAAPSLNLFSELVAPYPYQKLALIVGATRFGGMENANTIVFTPNLFNNFLDAKPRSQRYQIPSGVEEVTAHEIAHQWFGDSVTQSTWADLWLSEGFATYFAGLFLERNESKEVFRAYMKRKAQEYLKYEKRRRAPIHDKETEKLFDLLNANNYQKGAWVLHVLRGLLGDRDFFEGVKIYYNAHLHSTATTEDLRAAFEKASGVDLKNFFERWVYKAGHPIYQLTWKWSETKKGTLELTLKQTQDDEAFLVPVTIEITTKKNVRRIKILPDRKETTMKIQTAKPTKIVIDPDDFILKEIVTEFRVTPLGVMNYWEITVQSYAFRRDELLRNHA
jgi:aminopeptidase N